MTKTYYVQGVASEFVSGYFVTETEIDRWILDDLLDKYCSEKCNTCGIPDVYTDGVWEGQIYTAEEFVVLECGEYLAPEFKCEETTNIFTSGGEFGTENEERITNALQKLLANTTPEERDEMVLTLKKFDALSAA